MANENRTRTSGTDYANAALGAYSLIRGLTAKKPKRLALTPFTPVIRPAASDPEGLAAAKNNIAQQTDSASRDVTRISGSDVGAGLNARLGIQANASKAIADAQFNNSQLFRQDQNRVSQEQNQAALYNNQLINEQNQINQQQDRENYAVTQQAASSGIQSALQYEAARNADLKNKQAAETQSNQFIDAVDKSHWYETYNTAITRGSTPEEAKAIADQALKDNSVGSMKTSFYTGKRSFFGRSRK